MTIPAAELSLSGYAGHLDATQQSALEQFKDEISTELASDPEPRWYDETTLLRFLRARSFNVANAKKQFMTTDKWRKEIKPEDIYRSYPVDDLERSRAYYPRWTGRRDRLGRPVYVYKIGAISKEQQKELFSKNEDERYHAIIALTEHLLQFTFGMCSYIPSKSQPTPISCVTTIIDLAGISLGIIWTLKSHLQQSMSLSSAHYPETLNTIAIVNAPSFFSTIWNLVKHAFDEGTRNKIHVLGSAPGPALEEIINLEDIPVVYGGTLNWKYEDEPVLDAEIQAVVGEKLPPGPIKWHNDKVELYGSDR